MGPFRPPESEKVNPLKKSEDMPKNESKSWQAVPNCENASETLTSASLMPSKFLVWPEGEIGGSLPKPYIKKPNNQIEDEDGLGGRAFSEIFSERGGARGGPRKIFFVRTVYREAREEIKR